MKSVALLAALVLLFLFRAPAPFAAPASFPDLTVRQWTVDGVARKALLSIPPTAISKPTPVVFVFHGHGGSMEQAARSFHIQEYWPEAIIVYMQGLNTAGQLTDPNGLRAGWQKGPGDQNDRDLKFFDAVFASLRRDYKVDISRVFATGHSNGGGFTYLLWAVRGRLFRAVAPSSAVPGPGERDLMPKPVLHLAGEQDPLVRYSWQSRTIDLLKRGNGCEANGKDWARSGLLTGTEYTSKAGYPVVTLIHPGGHRFPQEAPALIVRFFKEVSKER